MFIFVFFTLTFLVYGQPVNFISSECFEDTNIEFVFATERVFNFDQAREECSRQNGILASLTSETKYNQLLQFYESEIEVPNVTLTAYVGLSKPLNDTFSTDPTQFIWEDGTKIEEGDFGSVRGEFPWLSGRPNNNGVNGEEQGCMILGSDFLLNDFICRTRRLFFCERSCNINEEEEGASEEQDLLQYFLFGLISFLVAFIGSITVLLLKQKELQKTFARQLIYLDNLEQ